MQQHDQKQLHEIARDKPCYMFTGEEICVLCNVSQNVVSRVKAHPDSPFFLNKCRPEWFLEFMRNHPEFQLTKAQPDSPAKRPATKDPAPLSNRRAGRAGGKDPNRLAK
jgi:hypothetical protein